MELIDVEILGAAILAFLIPGLIAVRLVVKQFKHDAKISEIHMEGEESNKAV